MKPQKSLRIRLSGQISPLLTSETEAEKELEGYSYQSSPKSLSSGGGEHSRDFSLLKDEAKSSEELVASRLGLLDLSSCPVRIVEDDAGQREVTLEYDCYTLGRDPQNDIWLRSQFASRFHAVLQCSDRIGQVFSLQNN